MIANSFQATADEIWIGALSTNLLILGAGPQLKCFTRNRSSQSARTCKRLLPHLPIDYLALCLISTDGFLSYQQFTPAANRPTCTELYPGGLLSRFFNARRWWREKARLFRISMTIACNAVTGVGCKIPGQHSRAGRMGNKLWPNETTDQVAFDCYK